jgi:conjugal transfer pilus assembly protein TraB
MRLTCPPWMRALPRLVRTAPLVTVGVLALGGVLAWHSVGPEAPQPGRVRGAAAVPTVRPTVTTRDPLEKQMDDLRQQNTAQQETQATMTKLLKELERKAEADAKARAEEHTVAAQRLAHQQQQFDTALQQIRTSGQRERGGAAPPAAAVRTTERTAPPETPAPPRPQALFELRTVLPQARSGTLRPLPPLANQQETAYLAAGCLAEVKVVTGVMATSQLGGETWGHPVLFSVSQAFHCPWRLGGSGVKPSPSGLELAGCFALGKAKADMSSSRAIIAVELLSCVFPDGSSTELPIKAYAVDQDGTLGIVGELHTHDSAKLAKAFLTGLIQEASAAFGLAKSQLVVTGNTGGPQPFQGAQTTLQHVANFWLGQARALLPTLWVRSQTRAYLVLLEGLPLQGYPVVALMGGR